MRVLVAIDGSPCSLVAVRAAIRLALNEPASLLVLAVAQLAVDAGGYEPDAVLPDRAACNTIRARARARADDALERARAILADEGIEATYMLVYGDPVTEILRVAGEQAADLVVLGSHAYGPTARLFLGSISEAVLRRWRGSTLIAREPLPAGGAARQAKEKPSVKTIRQAMTANPICATLDMNLQEASQRMRDADTGILPVLDGDRLVGAITDRDIVIRAIAMGRDPRQALVRDFQSRDVCTVGLDIPVDRAIQQMETRRIRRLFVVDQDRLVGVVSLGDLAECEPGVAEEVLVEVSKSPKTLAHGHG